MWLLKSNPSHVTPLTVLFYTSLQVYLCTVCSNTNLVAMEGTGIYCEALYAALEPAGLRLSLLHAYQAKQLKGKKTDRDDPRRPDRHVRPKLAQLAETLTATLDVVEAGFRECNEPFGAKVGAMGEMYQSAGRMMFSSEVESAFSFTDEESARYGGTEFGDSALVERKIVEQVQGTRFIPVDHGGWDHHSDNYEILDLNPLSRIYSQSAKFDPAFAAKIECLDQSGKLSDTPVVVCGEFGRTPGPLSISQSGRDRYLQMFYVFACGGIQRGKVIGATNDRGGRSPARSRRRPAGPETVTSGPRTSRQQSSRPSGAILKVALLGDGG